MNEGNNVPTFQRQLGKMRVRRVNDDIHIRANVANEDAWYLRL